MDLWVIYSKIEEFAKNFCNKRFYYSKVKEEECFFYITNKVLENNMAKIKSYKGRAKESTFAFIVAKNLLTDFTKKLSTNAKHYELQEELQHTNSTPSDLSIEDLKKHFCTEDILILEFKIEGLSSKEIAPLVDKTPIEVDRAYQKIKKSVKKLID